MLAIALEFFIQISQLCTLSLLSSLFLAISFFLSTLFFFPPTLAPLFYGHGRACGQISGLLDSGLTLHLYLYGLPLFLTFPTFFFFSIFTTFYTSISLHISFALFFFSLYSLVRSFVLLPRTRTWTNHRGLGIRQNVFCVNSHVVLLSCLQFPLSLSFLPWTHSWKQKNRSLRRINQRRTLQKGRFFGSIVARKAPVLSEEANLIS